MARGIVVWCVLFPPSVSVTARFLKYWECQNAIHQDVAHVAIALDYLPHNESCSCSIQANTRDLNAWLTFGQRRVFFGRGS